MKAQILASLGLTIIACFFTLSSCCHPDEPNPPLKTILLKIENIYPQAIILRVYLIGNEYDRWVTIRRDSQIIFHARVTGNDTGFSDVNIMQISTYRYKAFRQLSQGLVDSTEEISVTTNHGWRTDTLRIPSVGQMTLYQLWGKSYNQLYAIGHSSTGFNNLWKWDGLKWDLFRPQPYTQLPEVVDLASMWGISGNDFWICGERITGVMTKDSAFIGHWNGSIWMRADLPEGLALYHIWGSSNEDVYSGGISGNLFHFDGTHWKSINNDPLMRFGQIWGRSASEVYCLGSKLDTTGYIKYWVYLLNLHSDGYTITDSLFEDGDKKYNFGSIGVWGTSSSTYSYGYGIFKKNQNTWEEVFHTSYTIGDIKGTSDTCLFAVGSNGLVFKSNGVSWKRPVGLPSYPTIIMTSVWVDDHEVFILGIDDQRSYVYHYK